MQTTLAFDVYGTLIDTNGVVTALEKLIGGDAQKFSQSWRDKQLEYSFDGGLCKTTKTSRFAQARRWITPALFLIFLSRMNKKPNFWGFIESCPPSVTLQRR